MEAVLDWQSVQDTSPQNKLFRGGGRSWGKRQIRVEKETYKFTKKIRGGREERLTSLGFDLVDNRREYSKKEGAGKKGSKKPKKR